MIAVVQLDFENKTHFAALHDDGTWTCADPSLKITLRAFYDPKEKCGPEDGSFGIEVVEKALAKFNGKAVWIKPQDNVERVY